MTRETNQATTWQETESDDDPCSAVNDCGDADDGPCCADVCCCC